MAFPQVVDGDTQSGTVTTNSSSWTLTYPTNLVAGDLILAFVAVEGTPSFTWPTGWVQGVSNGGATLLGFAKMLSLGTESGTFALGLSAGEQGSWRTLRITGWEGTIGVNMGTGSAEGGGINSGTGINPIPLPFNPFNWNVEDTLWFAIMAADTSRTVSVWPSGTTDNGSTVSGGSNGATLAWCRLESAIASWSPSSFTISSSDEWAAAIVAVRPAAAPTRVPYRNIMPPLIAQ